MIRSLSSAFLRSQILPTLATLAALRAASKVPDGEERAKIMQNFYFAAESWWERWEELDAAEAKARSAADRARMVVFQELCQSLAGAFGPASRRPAPAPTPRPN